MLGRMNGFEFSMKPTFSADQIKSSQPRSFRRLHRRLGFALAAVLALLPEVHRVLLAGPSLLSPGQPSVDQRLAPPKDLDGYFPFTPPASVEAWTQRSAQLRRQILTTMGLWPMPTRNPLNPVIHGRVDREDYTVEKVYFESMPGLFVTGNLYRPKGKTGKLPGVLCPHGHWPDGRFYDNPKVGEEIVAGAERFQEGGRSVLQARCVQLVRMGCVVFHYDMLGYADSLQIPMGVAHGFSRERPEMNTSENWGLFSPAAESHAQSVMGLQTFQSIRSLDFLLTLPEVDPARIGVTGASGGGTQTFILGAIDPRPAVAFPAVMVSTAMQGGCTCENASGLRVDTGNVEFAALFAPKPLGLTGADDWTRDMATKGYPELQQLYRLLGKPDQVFFKPFNHFGHNYNSPSRSVMYAWMNRHLKIGVEDPGIERDYKRLTKREMSVWDDAHPQPEGGAAFERRLLRWWHDDARRQLTESAKDPVRFRELYLGGIKAVLGRSLPAEGEVVYEQTLKQESGSYWVLGGMLSEARRKETTPVVFYHPKEWNGRVVIWVHAQGKAGLCDPGAGDAFKPGLEVGRLLAGGVAVATLDVLLQGDLLPEGVSAVQAPRVKNNREAAAFTLGYNSSIFASRVQDVLRLVSFVRHHERTPKSIELVGIEGAGHWVSAARAVCDGVVTRAVVDSKGFRFGQVKTIRHPDLLPGGAKYGDLPGMLAAAASGKLLLAGETGESRAFISAAFQGSGDGKAVTFEDSLDARSAVDWLLR